MIARHSFLSHEAHQLVLRLQVLTAGSISGDNFDISGVPHGLLRPIQSQAPSAPWLFPTPDIWGDKVCNKLFRGALQGSRLFSSNCCSIVCCFEKAPRLAYIHRLHPALTWWLEMSFEASTYLSFLRLHGFRLHPAGATMPRHALCAVWWACIAKGLHRCLCFGSAALTTSVGLCSGTTTIREGWQRWHRVPRCCKTCLLSQVVVETGGGDKYRGTAEDIKRLLADLDLKQQVSAVLASTGSLQCTQPGAGRTLCISGV